jgi:response regulator RpfG family c-di-GMP phosphodiesterase
MLRSLHQNDPDQLNQVHNVIYMMGPEDRKLYSSYTVGRELNILEANNGKECLELLKKHVGKVSAIVTPFVLDDMEGIDLLNELKRKLEWNYIPTIVLTSDINEKNLVESVNAGAFYYLERPFGESVFASVLNKAIKDYTTYVFYLNKAQNVNISRLVHHGQFKFRTFKEGYEVADWLASLCLGRSRDDIVVGFIELLINAVEHGNLEIGYDEKSERMKSGQYLEGLVSKLEEPEFKDRYVTVDFSHKEGFLEVVITDEGKGFDFSKYLVMDKKRMFHSHGKGIIMASNLYFDELEYVEPGNKVKIKINLK